MKRNEETMLSQITFTDYLSSLTQKMSVLQRLAALGLFLWAGAVLESASQSIGDMIFAGIALAFRTATKA